MAPKSVYMKSEHIKTDIKEIRREKGDSQKDINGRAGFTQTRALFRKKCGGPHGRPQEFLQGGTRGSRGRPSPSGVQGQSPGGGLGAKPPEADGILLKMNYTDIAFLMWGPHFCGGPCSAEHAEHA